MKNNPIERLLAERGAVVLDGGLATELERRGADLRDPLWSAKLLLERPELIRQVHHDYFVAGAQVATTASYQATFPGLERRGLTTNQATDLMRLSVQLACDARTQHLQEHDTQHATHITPCALSITQPANTAPSSPSLLVAASIGPYGAFLHDGSEYRGDYGLSVEELMDFHRPRMAVLAGSGADLLACETIPCLAEAVALVRLLAEFPGTWAWLSFSCRDEAHVCHGELFAECVDLANQSNQVVAVGVNCSAPRFVEPLLRSAQTATKKPLVAYPNSGEAWDAAQQCWLPGVGLTDFAEPARRWYTAGARLIGGCCRTTPADIRIIAKAMPSQSTTP
jgi:homocysteine S-methyltransferase